MRRKEQPRGGEKGPPRSTRDQRSTTDELATEALLRVRSVTHPPGDGPYHRGAGKGSSGTNHTAKGGRKANSTRSARGVFTPEWRAIRDVRRTKTHLDSGRGVREDGGDLEASRALDVLLRAASAAGSKGQHIARTLFF